MGPFVALRISHTDAGLRGWGRRRMNIRGFRRRRTAAHLQVVLPRFIFLVLHALFFPWPLRFRNLFYYLPWFRISETKTRISKILYHKKNFFFG